MLRVYLDQAKWIDLANAAQGRPNGARFGDALTVVRAAVDRGLASFPLSAAHYLETCRRADPRSRLALARVMSEISRHHTIAGPQALVPAEVEAALHERFGRPLGPKTAQVFGFGASHAFNNPSLGLDYSFFERTLRISARALRDMVEKALLGGPSANLEAIGLGTRALGDIADRYRSGEDDLAARIVAHGSPRPSPRRRLMTGLPPSGGPLRPAGFEDRMGHRLAISESVALRSPDTSSRLPHAVPVADRVRWLPITVPGLPRWPIHSVCQGRSKTGPATPVEKWTTREARAHPGAEP